MYIGTYNIVITDLLVTQEGPFQDRYTLFEILS